MLQIFYECEKTSRHSRAAYREKFPDRRLLSHMTFKGLLDSLKFKGKFPDGKHDPQKRLNTKKENVENQIFMYFCFNKGCFGIFKYSTVVFKEI